MKSEYAVDNSETCAPPGGKLLQAGDEEWTTIISPDHPWWRLDLAQVWRYRELLGLFVRRDFVAFYKQTLLGPLWFFLQPLLTSLVFTLIFGRIAKIPTDGKPDFLFYLAGTVCWGYFSGCLTQSSDTFLTNAGLFGKVYFPRLVVPLATAVSHLLRFLIQFCLFLAVLFSYGGLGTGITPILGLATLPWLLLQMAFLGMGCGILISSLTTKYRDLRMVVAFGVQLWMFATPVVYPLSQVPGAYRSYFALNPMTPVVEIFRAAFLGTPFPGAGLIILGWITTLLLLATGLLVFTRVEKTFIDTI